MGRRNFLKMAGLMAFTPLAGHAAPPSGTAREVDSLHGIPNFLRNRDRSTVVAQDGMVCASQPLAAMAGINSLQAGGSCIDAAIAANAVLGVTEPASNGLGGDLFAIVYEQATGKLHGLNSSGRAPAAWNLQRAQERGLTSIPRVSPLSWTVPGCVRGWQTLHERFGKLPWADNFRAAIHYATDGFPLSPLIAEQFRLGANADPSLRALYEPVGVRLGYGDVFRNPALARSLQLIADGGAAAFYEGEIAERMVAKSTALGGYLSASDLREHTADWVDPVHVDYRGWQVWELPPNGQGICVLQMLNLLEQFDIGSLTPNSVDHLHLFIEAKKLAFEDRARYYADPQFARVPVEWLVSKEYARKRAALIDPRKANTTPRPGDPPLDSDTIYMTAADRDGNMISLIQSLYFGFGSTLCPDGLGFSIQNRGECFSLDPGHANRLEPRKRPFHTIIPGFVTQQQRPVLSFGVMGGDFQPQGHCQVLMHLLDFGMSPQQAGDMPRIAHAGLRQPWSPATPGREADESDNGEIVLEPGFSAEFVAGLQQRGHRVAAGRSTLGGYQAIWREENPRRYFGGSDPRKDGAAIGY